MIIKSFEINKIKNYINKIVLIYGKNEELKKNLIADIIGKNNNFYIYEENEILKNSGQFIENLLSKSLFEDHKTILIKRATDKIFKVIEEANRKNLEQITIIIDSENLDKKSKLRSFIEKDKKNICIAFYPDNEQTLLKVANDFINNKKIIISQENLNLIVKKANGNRRSLLGDLEKILIYCINKKKIDRDVITKLCNLSEDHSISELINYCLAKNKNKTIYILNENNFGKEDCIIISRTLLNKSKNILRLCQEYEKNNNIDLTISSAKPPIFWKDKEITKQQIYNWSANDIKKLIFKISEIEFQIKKNLDNSLNLITDLIIEQSGSQINN
tara:strand:+ start:105 stop:1097 length:993 start_codon:yes stop_codon:yes gene_type:complete